MKRQCFRRIASALLALVLFASSMAIPSEVDAAVTAKSVIKKAVAELEAAESISGRMEWVRSGYYGDDKNNTFVTHIAGLFVNDNRISYGMWMFYEQGGGAFEEYSIEGKVFRKYSLDSNWNMYVDPSYDSEDSEGNTEKTQLTYLLKNLKQPKIISKNSKRYVISAKASGFKTFNITIDRKTNKIISIKAKYKKYESSLLNDTDTQTITGGTLMYSDIYYGENGVELPDDIEGLL